MGSIEEATIRRSVRSRRACVMLTTAACAIVLAAPPAAHAASFRIGFQQDGLTMTGDAAADTVIGDMRTTGADVLRVTARWDRIAANCGATAAVNPADLRTPAAACYQWGTLDTAVTAARSRGMDLIASVVGTPPWLDQGHGPYWIGRTSTQYSTIVARFADFNRAIGTRYALGSVNGFIRYWTMWNEPNSKTFWAPWTSNAPERYARLYVAGARQLHASSSTALVAPGPTGPKSSGMKPYTYIWRVQRELGRAAAGSQVNAWAHNAYAGGPVAPWLPNLSLPSIGIGNFKDLLTVLDSHASTRRKPVWVTEFAYETLPDEPRRQLAATRSQQAAWLQAAMRILWNHRRVRMVVWYVYRDPVARADWQSGVLASGGAKKPSYFAFGRPIAPSRYIVRRGGRVTLWGKTNVGAPSTAVMQFSYNRTTWRRVPFQRRRGSGVVTAARTINRTTFFRIRDAVGVGNAVRVAAP